MFSINITKSDHSINTFQNVGEFVPSYLLLLLNPTQNEKFIIRSKYKKNLFNLGNKMNESVQSFQTALDVKPTLLLTEVNHQLV